MDIGIHPATSDQIDALTALINTASRTTTVLSRSREAIEAALPGFLVAVRAGEIVGCGGLQRMNPTLVELRSLVITEPCRGKGIGSEITRALVTRAREAGFTRIFTLTDNPHFFERLGFQRTDFASLPEKVWNDCRLCPKLNECGEIALDLML